MRKVINYTVLLVPAALCCLAVCTGGCLSIFKYNRTDSGKAGDELKIDSRWYLSGLEEEFYARRKVAFACGTWNDTNRDGRPSFPGEFTDIKKSFHFTEPMCLVAVLDTSGIRGQRMDMKVFGPGDTRVCMHSRVLQSDHVTVRYGGGPGEDLAGWLFQQAGPGTYTASWYLNDRFELSAEFQVTGDTPGPVGGGVFHVIGTGETLTAIAGRYDMSLDELMLANRIGDPSLVKPGQKIVLWKYVFSHRVSRGEWLSKIARDYRTTVTAIKAANRLKSDKLAVGQKLMVPTNLPPASR